MSKLGSLVDAIGDTDGVEVFDYTGALGGIAGRFRDVGEVVVLKELNARRLGVISATCCEIGTAFDTAQDKNDATRISLLSNALCANQYRLVLIPTSSGGVDVINTLQGLNHLPNIVVRVAFDGIE